MKKNLAFCLLIPLLFLFACSPEKDFDEKSGQQPVRSYAGIDSVLANFETIQFKDLDEEYLEYSGSNESKFSKNLKGRTYFIVEGEDMYRFIAHRYRIKDFLSHDHYYARNKRNLTGGHVQYWLTDVKLLYRFLDLLNELENAGHDPTALKVKCSHRHPVLNKKVGGASRSQHLWGRAIDLRVNDIDQSGGYTVEDKQIVLDLLEDKVIANKGGVGRYPGSQSVHMDVRGWGARWDKQ